jgi:hypothetical protein
VTAGGAGAGALELGAQPLAELAELEGAQVGTEETGVSDQAGVSEDQAGVSEDQAGVSETAGVSEATALVVTAGVPVGSAEERPGQSVTVGAQEVMVTSSVS